MQFSVPPAEGASIRKVMGTRKYKSSYFGQIVQGDQNAEMGTGIKITSVHFIYV